MDRKLYSDQTGKFPVTSFKGHQYLMILYDMDNTGSILAEPMRNRSAGEMVRAYQAAMDRLAKSKTKPTMHIVLDNECSTEMKEAIADQGMTMQLVPPHDHRRNAVEKWYRSLKTTSSRYCAAQTHHFPWNCGVRSSHRQSDS